MLNNIKLNKRLLKVFNELSENWNVTYYRIAIETKIPHASLKYMRDNRFEWKLNHLLSITSFLERYGVKVSLKNLLNFEEKIPYEKIFNLKAANFKKLFEKNKKVRVTEKYEKAKIEKIDNQKEANNLKKEIEDIVEYAMVDKRFKAIIELRITGNKFKYKTTIKS